MGQPYPRIIVLHFAVLLGFAWTLGGRRDSAGWSGAVDRVLDWVSSVLPATLASEGITLVLMLLCIKTVVDVLTTFRVTRPR